MANSRVKYLEGVVAEQREIIEALQVKNEEDAFIANIDIIAIEEGGWEVKCSRGLWSVHAPTIEQATLEGIHYFRQYYKDGEYG